MIQESETVAANRARQSSPYRQQDTKEYLIIGVPKSEFSRSEKGGDRGGEEEESPRNETPS